MKEWKAEDLVKLLRERYAGNGYVVLVEVPDGTGMNQNRWIDAAVFSLWPSEGLTRFAFEIKVRRQDAMRELDNSAKHKWAVESFHEFYFVAPREVLDVKELPSYAGLLAPRGDKLVLRKHAPRNAKPKIDDVLLAAFMRAAEKGIKAERNRSTTELLASSKDYQTATIWMKAVQKFLNTKQIYFDISYRDTTEQDVLEFLNRATEDMSLINDRQKLVNIFETFQRRVAELFEVYAIIANLNLVALNDSVIEFDAGLLKTLEKQSNPYFQKRYGDIINCILNWHKLQKGPKTGSNQASRAKS